MDEEIKYQNEEDAALLRFIHRETSSSESRSIAERIKTDDNFRLRYKQLKEIADAHIVKYVDRNLDIDAAINKFEGFINNEKGKPITVKRKNVSAKYWLSAVAASLLIILAYFFMQPGRVEIKTSNGAVSHYVLPDSSMIWLNTNSSLSYSKRFNRKSREIKFSGEAFFKISHSEKNPFIIHTNNGVSIKVVGTEFNVKTDPKQKTVTVSVKMGKVLTSFKGESYKNSINKGQTMLLNTVNKACSIMTESPVNSDAWRTGVLDFKETSLKQVVRVLNDFYSSDIRLNDGNLGYLQITSRFEHEKLDSVLEVISFIYGLQIEKKNGVIYLSSKKK